MKIEHRLFPHITRACQGVVFHTLDILVGIYETGKKCATDFIENMRIVFDDFLPRWNYRAMPHS